MWKRIRIINISLMTPLHVVLPCFILVVSLSFHYTSFNYNTCQIGSRSPELHTALIGAWPMTNSAILICALSIAGIERCSHHLSSSWVESDHWHCRPQAWAQYSPRRHQKENCPFLYIEGPRSDEQTERINKPAESW
ncbi:uncharacterized protein BO72DRAFT_38239 [Aspergillus fijiensis CBS 313.89]|uniref:Uncharacterized protein n=1 Tax=Aspergillus fijiensis CBS 313.89 TaxID=1448319 RepID=A0A8G1RC33_9EURO|nr:uncharacterized protein BO72DRAFT_38239 [Aspergillus fijiensis CBS 313.89]RAK71017.1 hypothetical protein BO72DRAFT_38239 [Aspergillus fijiensis CBS 313.89]